MPSLSNAIQSARLFGDREYLDRLLNWSKVKGEGKCTCPLEGPPRLHGARPDCECGFRCVCQAFHR